MPRREKGRGSLQDQNMPHFNISYGGGSVEGEAVETTKQLVKYEKYVKGKVPGGTLNTGGRAGRVLLKEHLVGPLPAGSLLHAHTWEKKRVNVFLAVRGNNDKDKFKYYFTP